MLADSALLPIARPMTTPMTEVRADKKLNNKAIGLGNPALMSKAKSPSSCGISCKETAIVVDKPTGNEALNRLAKLPNTNLKVAPIARPSVKLCTPSATRFMMPNDFTSLRISMMDLLDSSVSWS